MQDMMSLTGIVVACVVIKFRFILKIELLVYTDIVDGIHIDG